MEGRFVYTVILCARSLCTQGRLICGLASYAGSSSSVNFFYHGAVALVARASSVSRVHDHIQLNTVQFSPKIMGQSVVFLVLWKIRIKS